MNRELRNTLVLAVIAISVGSYMLFVESRKTVPDESVEKEDGSAILSIKADSVEEVVFAGKSEFRLVQSAPEKWQVRIQGTAHDADPASVADLVSAFNSLRARKLEMGAQVSDNDLGLDIPVQTLIISLKGGSRYELRLGGETPMPGSRYLRLGGETYAAKSFALHPFDRTPEDLRNKKLVRTEPAKVYRVRVRWGAEVNAEVEMARTAEGWKFSDPSAGKVDVNHLEDFLSELRLLRVSKFSGKGQESFRDYGIDNAVMDVVLYDEKDELLDRVRLGVKDPATEGTWTWSDNFGELVQVSKFSVDQLPKNPDWLKVKDTPQPEPAPSEKDIAGAESDK